VYHDRASALVPAATTRFFSSNSADARLAARFVSGYLYEAPPADGSPRYPTAMHAWAEVYLPGAGWRGLDPTHAVFCDDAFVPWLMPRSRRR